MPIYNQRWLREHKAVPTDRGWKRSTSNEMLKMQKGLNVIVPEQPIFISSTMYDVPKYVLVDPVSLDTQVKVKYKIDEPDYEPMNIEPRFSVANGLIMDYVVDTKNKEITYNFHNVRADGSSTRLELYVEGKRSTNIYETVYFSLNHPNPKVVAIYLSDLLKTLYVYKSNGYKGHSSNFYRVFDTVYHYEHDDVEVLIDYDGEGNVYATRPNSNSPTNINNSVWVHAEGDVKSGEIIKVRIKIGDVISNEVIFKVSVVERYNGEIIDTPEDFFDNFEFDH